MSRKLMVGIVLLCIVTGIVASLHLINQEDIPCMELRQGDQKISVSFEELDQTTFSGELINGKGDKIFHEYTGILLRELLEMKGIDLARISTVTVTSADHYSVEFTSDEILQTDKIYVAITADGAKIEGIDPGSDGVQIIVFQDPNSRRCVRFAQIIEIKSHLPSGG